MVKYCNNMGMMQATFFIFLFSFLMLITGEEQDIKITREDIPLDSTTCGEEKGCFYFNKKESGSEVSCCDVAVSYQVKDDALSVVLVGNHDGYIAVGFTNGASVTSNSELHVCFTPADPTSVYATHNRFNYSYVNNEHKFEEAQWSGTDTISLEYKDGWLNCQFDIKRQSPLPNIFSMGNPLKITLSYGEYEKRNRDTNNVPTSVDKSAISPRVDVKYDAAGISYESQYVCGSDEKDVECNSSSSHSHVTSTLILIASLITFCLALLQ